MVPAKQDPLELAKSPMMRSVPALYLSYANVLLWEIAQREPISLDQLFDEVGDVEALFKSEHEHTAPVARAKQFVRYARELGLMPDNGDELVLTDRGREYVAARDPGDPFGVTSAQSEVLRECLFARAAAGGVAWGAALAASLVASSEAAFTAEQLGRALAVLGGMSQWREKRTFESQGHRFRALLTEAGLLSGNDLTNEGAAFVAAAQVPEHHSLQALAQQQIVSEDPADEDTAGPSSWIFQANPARWDLISALGELSTFDYEVNQSQKQIKAGHTVYLWLSGPKGGVCASARVLTDPAEIPLRLREHDRFWKQGPPVDDGKLRVWLRVLRVLDEPLLRDFLKGRPETAELPVLLFANATNFDLTEAHAEELHQLVAAAAGRDVPREKLFFFTASSVQAAHHLQTSLIDGIALEDLAELGEIEDKLEHHAVDGRVFAWGARPGQAAEKKWERLNPGDVALIYRDGQFVLWGRVYAKARSKKVAERIWGDAGGETWDCMYFLDPVVKLGTARQDVVTTLGYQPNYIPQGFEIPGESTQQAILQQYPTLLHFVDALSTSDPKPPPPPPPPPPSDYAEPSFDHIQTHMQKIGLRVSDESLRQYHLSLKTRGFVVLAGISGGGKTWLAEAYANAVGAEPLVVAVAPNWTTNEDLLGYRSPIDNEYRHTPFSVFLQEASNAHASALASNTNPQPFHLILDEMNLARVEYYFARFLSAMELRARHGVASLELAPDLHVDLTPNLKFIGTVNIDETTFGFADKVYDRAQLVTLHVERDDLAEHVDGQPHAARVLDIWDALREVAPFAYRVLDEIAAYVKEADKIGVSWQNAVDDQLEQKVLPKVKGADQRIKPALEAFISLTKADMPRSSAKAQHMLDAYNAHGFASYF